LQQAWLIGTVLTVLVDAPNTLNMLLHVFSTQHNTTQHNTTQHNTEHAAACILNTTQHNTTLNMLLHAFLTQHNTTQH
jgi:hypothetical protein